MKILIGNDGYSAHYYERMGLAKAFSACNHKVALWDINNKPAHDVFDEFEPDLFLFQTYNLNRSIIQAISERPHLKCIMKAGDWGDMEIDTDKYQVLMASEQEKNNTLKLYEETGQPEYISIHYPECYVHKTHNKWGIPVKSQMLAADIFDYTNGTEKEEFKCDLTFIGGYWPYKAQIINEYLIPLCRSNKYKIKIFGNSVWPVHQYCGGVPNELVKHILASASICPNLNEPHASKYGFEVNERVFKLLSNKCFVISEYVEGLSKIFDNEEILFAHNPEEFEKLIDHYLKYPREREPYIQRGYKKVMSEHTYFDRIIEIFENLNLHNDSNLAKQHKENVTK